MIFSTVFTDEAREDAALAVKWYNEQKAGIGDSFLNYLSASLQKIQNYPTAYKKIYRQVRQAAVEKFPYVILFKVTGEVITVYAIFHTSQHPKKKFRKLKK